MSQLPNQAQIQSYLEPARPSVWTVKTLWAGLAIAAIVASVWPIVGSSDPILNLQGWALVAQFFQASLHPDLSSDFLWLIGGATLTTLAYAVCGTALSVGLGLVGGLLSSEVWWQTLFPQLRPGARWGWTIARALLALPRAVHELIWGLFFVNILGLEPLVAVLAIAIPFGATCAKVFSEILDETPRQPFYALLGGGVSPLRAFLYGLVPQAFPNLLSYSFYRFECSIRSAAVLGIIGAGGLGYQIFLSLQSLRYEQLWTGFLALIALTGLVDAWSALLRRRMGFTSRLDLNLPRQQQARAPQSEPAQSRSHQTDRVVQASWLAVILVVPLCFAYLPLDWSQLWAPQTARLLADVADAAFPVMVNSEVLVRLLLLSWQTLAMSILAITLAGLGGILLSFPAAHNVLLSDRRDRLHSTSSRLGWRRGLWLLSRGALLVCRSIPAPIWALVWLFIFFPGILPGAIALGLHNLGILGRLMAEVNENLDERGVRSLRTLGASGPQAVLYGILPQNLPRFLAYILYRWEVCIRATVIVGLVGAGGLGRLLTEQLSSFDYSGVLFSLSVFVALTLSVDLLSSAARKALR